MANKVHQQLDEARKLGLFWQAEEVANLDRLEESTREFGILEGACDFWREEAVGLGYME